MKKWTKRLLILSGILVVFGILFAFVGLAASGFSIGTMSGATYVSNTASITDDASIEGIALDFSTSDVTVEYSAAAEKISITYETKQSGNGEALTTVTESLSNGIFSLVERRSWKANINLFNFYDMKVKVIIPESRAVALDIEADTGDVTVKGAKLLNRIKVTVDTGDLRIEDSKFSSVNIETDTGDALLNRVEISDTLRIEVDTGDVSLKNTSAASMGISSDTGDVALKDVSAATSLNIETDTGDVDLNGSLSFKAVYIETDTGDIDGDDALLDADSIEIDTNTGDVELHLAGAKYEYGIIIQDGTGKSNVKSQQGGTRQLKFTSSTGDGEFYFAD